MCGLVGFSGKGDSADVERMIATLHHRGPDDTGVFFAHGVGLGHARLSIIDVTATGHQPMWTTDKTVGIVFNGEIYNFAELKKQCVVSGYRFAGNSDTEVILALYQQFGVDCFEKLNGMFAIALYDTKTDAIILARDRAGKKPLYYGTWDDTFVFGSEPKALLTHPSVKKEIDTKALNAYFALDYVPTPLSIWRGMKKLLPGTFLIYQGGDIHVKPFWSPETREERIEFSDALKKLDEKLRDAVVSRLVSDVPLGIFLSGGLDSSTVAYYAAKAKKKDGQKIHTFSIGFTEASFDESVYAQKVAKHLDTIHHHKIVSSEDSLGAIPQIFSSLDEPLADASIIPTYLLSRFARESVTVALGGDGGDELFAGYPTFQAERLMPLYRLTPPVVRHIASALLLRKRPESFGNFSIDFILKKFFDGADEKDIARRHQRWLGAFDEKERAQLFKKDVWESLRNENVYLPAEEFFAESHAYDERNKLLFSYQRSFMMDEVMVKVDRASMMSSLETRAPILDYTVVEFANRLPYDYKLHGITTKYILKKLMEGKLPDDIIYRKKKGFGIPVGSWLRGPLRAWGEELLSGTDDLIDLQYAQKLFAEHLSGKVNHRKKLWNIFVYREWKKHFVS